MGNEIIFPAIGVFLELAVLYYIASIPADSELAGLVLYFMAMIVFIIVYAVGIASFGYGAWMAYRAGNREHSKGYRLLRRQFIIFPATALMGAVVATQVEHEYAPSLSFIFLLTASVAATAILLDILLVILGRNLRKK